jgi:transcriptional regulator with XRE-family HTH domain
MEIRYKIKLYIASNSCNEGYKPDLYTTNMRIGDRIKERRTELGKSQEWLADKAGVKYQSVQQWESNETSPRGKRLSKIAAALQTTEQYLMFGNEVNEVREPSARNYGHDRQDLHDQIDKLPEDAVEAVRMIILAIINAHNHSLRPGKSRKIV